MQSSLGVVPTTLTASLVGPTSTTRSLGERLAVGLAMGPRVLSGMHMWPPAGQLWPRISQDDSIAWHWAVSLGDVRLLPTAQSSHVDFGRRSARMRFVLAASVRAWRAGPDARFRVAGARGAIARTWH